MGHADQGGHEPNTASSGGDRHPVEAVAEQFVTELRRGEKPSVPSYIARYPHLADELNEILPTLEMLEHVGGEPDGEPSDERSPDANVARRIGPYRVLREVGRGGMGIVYEAQHETMRRRVALKVLPPNVAADRAHLERFHREARAAGRLHHSNIVPVFEVGSDDDVHYYAMQFIRGQSLDAVFQDLRRLSIVGSGHTATRSLGVADERTEPTMAYRLDEPTELDGRPSTAHWESDAELVSPPHEAPTHIIDAAQQQLLPNSRETERLAKRDTEANASSTSLAVCVGGESYFRRVAHIGLQIAEALAYAHRQGVLHRDIKPANLILDTAGIVWVTDFGLAKDRDDGLTRTGDLVGTLRYLAPERLERAADARSDVYGLGLTLYELCTLQHAFDMTGKAQLLRQLSHHQPTAPRQLNPAIPRDLETIILKAIDKHPEHRYASARQMTEDLQLFLEDRPIRSRPIATYERCWRWCRRNPQQALLASVAMVLLGIVLCGSLLFAITSNHHAKLLRAETDRARENERLAQRRLYDLSRGRSQALRWTGRPGQRLEGLEAIQEAVAILPQLGFDSERQLNEKYLLRNEAVANLALPDVAAVHQWNVESPWTNSVAFTADYDRYAQGSQTGEIVVRRVTDNALIQRLPGPGQRAWIIMLSPNGLRLAAKYHDPEGPASVRMWNVESGECLLERTMGRGHATFAFHPENRHLALGTPRGIELLDPVDGRLLGTLPDDLDPAFLIHDPQGQLLASTDMARPIVHLWNLSTEQRQLFPTRGGACSVAFERDGATMHVGLSTGAIERIPLSDDSPNESEATTGTTSNRPLLEGHRGQVVGVAVDGSGQWLVSSSWDGTVRIWDLHSGSSVLRVDGMTSVRFQFHPDQLRIAFRSLSERRFGIWQLHHEGPFRILTALEDNTGYMAVTWRPGSDHWLVASHGTGVDVWDMSLATRVHRFDFGRTVSLWFTDDGNSLVTSGSEGIRRWNLHSEHVVPDGPPEVLLKTYSERFSVAGNGNLVAADQGMMHTVLFTPGSPAEPRTVPGHPGLDYAVLSPDGQWLATSTWQGQGIRIWSTDQLEFSIELEPDTGSASIAFSPQGDKLVISSAEAHSLYQVGSWDRIWQLERQSDDVWPGPVTFSPDGRTVAVSYNRRLIQLLDAATGRPQLLLESPRPAIYGSLEFRRDGLHLAATARQDIQVWDLGGIQQQLQKLNLAW